MSTITAQHNAVVAQLTGPGAPFETHRIDMGGHSVLAYKNAVGTLADVINEGRQHGNKLFLQYNGQDWSFDQFFTQVDQFAGLLQHHYGIAQGDRVAIAMRNRPEWLAAFCAVINIGAVAVPLNSWGKSEELHHGLDKSHAKVVICDQQRCDYIAPAKVGVKALLVDPATHNDEYTESLADLPPASAPNDVVISPSDEAILMFTSGTSGLPKGALFTHFNCAQALFNIEFIGAATYMTHQEKMGMFMAKNPVKTLFAVPLFHISGLFSQSIMTLKGGRSLYMMYKWDADEAIRAIREERVTVLMGAPTMMLDILQHPEIDDLDLSNISNISAGGAGTPKKLIQLYQKHLSDCLPGAGWGLTETAGTGAAFTGDGFRDNPTSSGFISPILEVSIRDENGVEGPQDKEGEIYIRSAACVQGYCCGSSPEDFVDGWFKTGDIGYVDENNLLYLCDRAKDMIIRGGENIYPAEVENCLIAHPDVHEAAVLGISDDTYGEIPVAVVVAKPGRSIDGEALKAFCTEHLAGFKVPTKFVVSAELMPRNPTKKLLKRQIKAAFFPAG
jgi:acyl-CoA synthetase (AMP-forming)/AMP-acid ligase II